MATLYKASTLDAIPLRRTVATMSSRSKVGWRSVALFTLLAYALTWAWDGIWIVPKLGTLFTSATTPSDPTMVFGTMLAHLPAMFGPLIAAVVMRLWISREGVSESLGVKRPWQHYAVAFLGPLAFFGGIAFVLVVTGLAKFKLPDDPLTLSVIPLFATLLLLESILGFGEEYGWRGYLLPRLMPLGEIPATLILGLIWSLWHFPVVLAGVLLAFPTLGLESSRTTVRRSQPYSTAPSTGDSSGC
jgi:membrane protease YdiL (CAAX protease family)